MTKVFTITSFLILAIFWGCSQEKRIPDTDNSVSVDTLSKILNQSDTTDEKLINFYLLKKEFSQKKKDLQRDEIPFAKYLSSSIVVYNDEKYAPHPEMQNIRQSIPTSFEFYNYKLITENLEPILVNDTIPEIFRYNILKGICREYTTSVKLDSALIYFQLIKRLFPKNEDHCIDYSFPCIEKTHRFLDSLKMENIHTSAFLFQEAESREKMINCSCWFGESLYNLSIVEEKYQELLSKFPNSEYADDAEFWLMNYQYYGDEEGGFPISEIPKIKRFITKYPNSNRIVELIMKIAYSYSIFHSENVEEQIEILSKGINSLKQLKLNYQLDSLQAANVNQTLKEYLHQLNKVIFDFTILPLKNQYKIGEDLEVEVILKNNSSKSQYLELFQNDSFFSFAIFPNKDIKFRASSDVDLLTKKFEILSKDSIKQKVNLTKIVRHWDGGKLGKFDIGKEGVYYLTSFSRTNNLNSQQVKIQVTNY